MMANKAVDVTAVEILYKTTVRLSFDDGVTRIIDLKPLMRGPVFEQIFQQKLFDKVRVDPAEGTIVWPNGADLDPHVLRFRSGGYARRAA